MVESVLLDHGDFGQVLMDASASYVRSWICGAADDPRVVRHLTVSIEAILQHHLRYQILDITRVRRRPTMNLLEEMAHQLPATARAGCLWQFTVLPPGHPTASSRNARTFHSLQAEYGIEVVEVSDLQDALDQICVLNSMTGGPGRP